MSLPIESETPQSAETEHVVPPDQAPPPSARPAGGRLRILFELPYPGYHRIYGSTIRLLAERGHIVLLTYDKPSKRRDADVLAAEAVPGVVVVDPLPWDRPRWGPVARYVRLTADYVRFLDPRFRDTPHLRRTMEPYLPARSHFLTRITAFRAITARIVLGLLSMIERAIPSDRGLERHIQALDPDVLVVTPLVTRGDGGVRQTDVVKAARHLGLPVAAAVTSWDHLSSKGLLRGGPDAVFVWNEAQRREAIELHRVPARKVVVTGAQLFDQWFAMRPTLSRIEFSKRAGLDPGRPYVLFVGSSKNISPAHDEIEFVRRWVTTLRKFGLTEPEFLIRPHPGNAADWEGTDISDLADTAVFPRGRTHVPMTESEEADYFHSLHFSSVVVGINTSAIIEAAIVGRPVYTVRAEEFAQTQHGTIHFRHLLKSAGGCLHVAEDMRAHVVQLRSGIRADQAGTAHVESRDFVASFVRPRGLDRASTPILVDEIERLGRRGSRRGRGVPLWLQPLRLFLSIVATVAAARSGRPRGAWPPRRTLRVLFQRRPRFDSPFAAVTAGGNNRSAAQFVRQAPRSEVYRFVARRYWSVVKAAWRGLRHPPVRGINAVAEIYEGHFDKPNKAYAKARDKRRDVFMVGRRPVAVDGWYTFAFHSDLLANVLERVEGRSVLEVGSGRGTNLALLGLRRPDLSLTGLELTLNGVEQSRELVAKPPQQYLRVAGMKALSPKRQTLLERTEFVQGNALVMPFADKSFDFSFTCLVLEQMPDDFPRILSEMRRVTRGHCAFIEPFRDGNGLVGKACLRSSNYFRASYESFADHGLEPVYFTTQFPQKVQFKTGLLIARIRD